MHSNEQVIHRFYTAFQQLDYATVQSCYSNDAVFNDPVFGLLNAREVKAMWEMLCKRAKDFSLTYSNIQILDDEYATCEWVAVYVFTKTGRKVENRIKAHMRFKDGLIIEHTDAFVFYRWARQALGIPGVLLGWASWMQNKIKNQALAGLHKFMQ